MCIFLIGPPGSGKSFIATEIINRFNMFFMNNTNSGTLSLFNKSDIHTFFNKINEDCYDINTLNLDSLIKNENLTSIEYINNLLTTYYNNNNYTYNYSIDNLIMSTNFHQILYLKYKTLLLPDILTKIENNNNDMLLLLCLKSIIEIFSKLDSDIPYYHSDDCYKYKLLSELDKYKITPDIINKLLSELDANKLETTDNIITILFDNIQVISKITTNFNNIFSSMNDCTSEKYIKNNTIYKIFKIITENKIVISFIDRYNEENIKLFSENLTKIYYKIRKSNIYKFKDIKPKSIDDLNDIILEWLIHNKKDFIFETTLSKMNNWYYALIIKLYYNNYKINAIFPYIEDNIHKNRLFYRLYNSINMVNNITLNYDSVSNNIIQYQISLDYNTFIFDKTSFKEYTIAFMELSYLINSIIGYDIRSFKKNIQYLNYYNEKRDIIYNKKNYMECNNGLCITIFNKNEYDINILKKLINKPDIISNNLINRYDDVIKNINTHDYMVTYLHFKFMIELIKNNHSLDINVKSIYILSQNLEKEPKTDKKIYTQSIETIYKNPTNNININIKPNLFNLLEINNIDYIKKYNIIFREIMNTLGFKEDIFLDRYELFMNNNSYNIVSAIYNQSFLPNFTKKTSDNYTKINKYLRDCCKGDSNNNNIYMNFINIICNEILSDYLSDIITKNFSLIYPNLKFFSIRLEDNDNDYRFIKLNDKEKTHIYNNEYKIKDDIYGYKIDSTYKKNDTNVLFSASSKLTTKNLINYCCGDWDEYINKEHLCIIEENYKEMKYNNVENYFSEINKKYDEKKQQIINGNTVSLDILCLSSNIPIIFDKRIQQFIDDEERSGQTNQILIKSFVSRQLIADSNDTDFTTKINFNSRLSNETNITLDKNIKSIISLFDVSNNESRENSKLLKIIDSLKNIHQDTNYIISNTLKEELKSIEETQIYNFIITKMLNFIDKCKDITSINNKENLKDNIKEYILNVMSIHKNKYLKYKKKYIKLKNNIKN